MASSTSFGEGDATGTGGFARARGVAAGAGHGAVWVRGGTAALTTPVTEPSLSPSPGSISIPGGEHAPALARRHALSQLDGDIPELSAFDAALIVSELVTNSVLHANVGIDRVVSLELTLLAEHLRIAVSDPGSLLEPRLLPVDPTVPGGKGLQLVDQLCSAWGVIRDALGTTCVWCELPLDRAQPS